MKQYNVVKWGKTCSLTFNEENGLYTFGSTPQNYLNLKNDRPRLPLNISYNTEFLI
jgi:hypothetical protein